MNKIIGDIMSRNVSVINADISAEEAESELNRLGLNCLPVVDDSGKCFGVLSGSDLLQLHGSNINLKTQRAWEICTPIVRMLPPSATIPHAIQLMESNRIHHIIVIESDSIVGILSVFDIIRAYNSIEATTQTLAIGLGQNITKKSKRRRI
jgi:CBS domain-containing protein